ncbi:MAG: ABC transporter substrate-binding protein, partial [Tepidiformaceae bacterium]
MRHTDNYWVKKLQDGGVTRRRFVGGAALAGVGVAGLGLVGCGDDNSSKSTPTAAGGASGSPSAATGSATAAGTATPQPKAGGVSRGSSSNATYDTFDASRSRFTPFASIVGMTNQRIIQWDSFATGKLGGAFAEKWEQPDATTLVLHLRPNNFWQQKDPVNGRQTTAADMKYHIDRNKAGLLLDGKTKDPNFYRYADYQIVDSTTLTDANTLTVKFTQPAPLFLNLLAQSYEVVQAPEAVQKFEASYSQFNADQIIGTGPYVLTLFNPDGHLNFKKYDKYYGKTWLDGIQQVPLFTDQAALQAAFEQKQVDGFSPSTVAQLNDLQSRLKDKIFDSPGFSANPIAGTFAFQGPPWSDTRLVGAIMRAYDRRQLIQQFHGGRGAISGSVPPTQGAFAITEKELSTFPGYLEDRAKELTDAKALWSAAGGDKLGDITYD